MKTIYKINEKHVSIFDEEITGSCSGCVFRKMDIGNGGTECMASLPSDEHLLCGENGGIYKIVKQEKGIKKKLILNKSLP